MANECVRDMQPDPYQPQQTVVVGQNTQFANNPYTTPQIIYVQNQPSVAPTVTGVLTIIYGVGSLILSLIGGNEPLHGPL